MSLEQLLAQDFGTIPDLIRTHAGNRPDHPALIKDDAQITFAELDKLMWDRVAASLQRDGLRAGDAIAICATASIEYAVVFLGALRASIAVAPLAPSSTPESIATMLADCGAKLFFLDATVAQALAPVAGSIAARKVFLDGSSGGTGFNGWLAPEDARPNLAPIDPQAAFNIIYSSGTTGAPKGIVQSHRMRWAHIRRGQDSGYGLEAVVLCSTPLYSNTTLVSFFPGISLGGTVVLMSKFDTAGFLTLAQKHRVTHSMLVPVQYQRLMDFPGFDGFDLSSFRMKFCTSAPFSAALKAQILQRWPGGLVEYYGMTEGGGTCTLAAHTYPDKLHTVGMPAEEHDIRLIDDQGNEVPRGQIGEVVGRSPLAMMTGYHNQPAKTRDAEWYDPQGNRFIRTGDVGRFDEQGFLTLMDRKKDMIISGGFNVYPSDLEAVLAQHEAVAEAAVVGVPSVQWGETPIAFVVRKPGSNHSAEDIRRWTNERLGKTQRLTDLRIVDTLPRSAIGKVLKRELRDTYTSA